jgi:pantothenate kinase
MKEEPSRNALEARFMRRHMKEGGYDEEEEEEEHNFKDNIEKAIKSHSRKIMTKDVEQQVEYFGYKIEPFHMREEEEMG